MDGGCLDLAISTAFQQHAAMRGTVQDDVNMLDLAMPK
jgi:hypothetical protein